MGWIGSRILTTTMLVKWQRDADLRGAAWPGEARRGMAGPGMARHGTGITASVGFTAVRRTLPGEARFGEAGQGQARPG